MPGFINLHAHLGDAQKAPDAEYTFKLWMANGITTIRGVELATQPLAMREKTRSASNATVDAAHLQLPASRPRLARRPGRHAGESARVGALVRGERRRRHEARRLPAGDHGGAARRGQEARPGIRRAPRAARRRADERAHRREARARHRHAFLRALRTAAQGLRDPAVARRR